MDFPSSHANQSAPPLTGLIVLSVACILAAAACAGGMTGNIKVQDGPVAEDMTSAVSAAGVERESRTAEEWFDHGVNLSEEGRYAEAKKAFKKAIRGRPGFAAAHYRLGVTYRELNDRGYALRAFELAVHLNPDFAEAYYELGKLHREQGNDQLALSAFMNAVRINPEDADAYYLLGEVYLDVRMKNEAKEAFMQAIKIRPGFAEAHYGLGTVYVKFNNISSAFDEYKILSDLDRTLAYKLFKQIYR